MRWYVNRSGQTVGPLDDANIMHWAETGQITRGMSFQAETGGPWLPVEQSPFARFVSGPQPQPRVVPAQPRFLLPWWVWTLMFLTILGFVGQLRSMDRDAKARRAAQPATPPVQVAQSEPTKPRECILSVPGRDGSVLLFPTEEGYDEWGTASGRGESDDARKAVALANGAFFVDRGTRCSIADLGLLSSKVRVVEGPSSGRAGWVPNEWHRGN